MSPKPTSALQCNSFLVKEAQQHHGPVERDEPVGTSEAKAGSGRVIEPSGAT